MADGDTESENASRVIQDFVFLCRKIGSINGYFCRYIIKCKYSCVKTFEVRHDAKRYRVSQVITSLWKMQCFSIISILKDSKFYDE